MDLDQLTADVTTLKAEVAELKAALGERVRKLESENESLKQAPKRGSLSMKVSAKGALSIYGLGRFPVTLYKEQWERLLDADSQIRQFLTDNESLLKSKEQAAEEAANTSESKD